MTRHDPTRTSTHRLLRASILATAVAMTGCGTSLAANQTTPKTGDIAPPLSGTDQQNQPVSLAKLSAKGPVLVVFYRGHW